MAELRELGTYLGDENYSEVLLGRVGIFQQSMRNREARKGSPENDDCFHHFRTLEA